MTATEREVIELVVKLLDDSVDDLRRSRGDLREDMAEYSRILAWLLINKYEVRATQRKRMREFYTRRGLDRLWELSGGDKET